MPGVEDRVKQIIVDQLGVDAGDVTAASSFVDDLGADSLDRVELIMALEETFGMEIPDEDAMSFKTVDDIMTFLRKHMAVASVAPSVSTPTPATPLPKTP